MIHRVRVPELGGAVVDFDAPAWQTMIRSAQTPAFCVAMIGGLVVAALGAATPPLLADRLTPHPAHTPMPLVPATVAGKLEPSTHPAPPLGDMELENPERLDPAPTPEIHDKVPNADPDRKAPISNPDLDAALDELEQQANRDEALASQDPAPPFPGPTCPPICTDSSAVPTQHGLAPDADLGGP